VIRAGRLLPARAAALACLAAGCQPNPRSEIEAIATAGLAALRQSAPAEPPCVGRTIAPWQPPSQGRRPDPSAPPGFAGLYAPGVFRGGGGLKGAAIGGVAVSGRPGCIDLRGPLIDGDRAMLEAAAAPMARNLWLRRTDGQWRVVATTLSRYSR
jgi:hypothetical protein